VAHNTPPVPTHDVWTPGGCGTHWLAQGNAAGQTTIALHRFWYFYGVGGGAYVAYYTEGLIRERWSQTGYECGFMGRPRSNPAVATGPTYSVIYQQFEGGCISYRAYPDGFVYGPVLYCLV
jgi:hypothetical protein